MLRVLNDVHIGVQRAAGTTPPTQFALRQHLLIRLKQLLPYGGDLLINGDLFDTGNVPMSDVFEVYRTLTAWMHMHPTSKLYNAAGNHDLPKNSSILSSFQFLGKLLAMTFPERYVHIEQPMMTPYGYVIPHLANQDLFNLALQAVPQCGILFLHCNYDNNFAVESDQSLNLSREQAAAVPAVTIVIAHEHHPRTVGKVIIPGNQIASSVSDWMDNSRSKRYIDIIEDELTLVDCAVKEDEFVEMQWDQLVLSDHKFVRVTGKVPSNLAGDVVTAINRFRTKHSAFVIANAVKVISEDSAAIMEQSLEGVAAFSVLDALKELMTAEEFKVIEDVMSKG